jgi:hypothetical protein
MVQASGNRDATVLIEWANQLDLHLICSAAPAHFFIIVHRNKAMASRVSGVDLRQVTAEQRLKTIVKTLFSLVFL